MGSVVSLWRYPVKSMMGEELPTTLVTDGGLLGDRGYGVIDQSNGKVASAKYPRKWGKLFDCRAALMEPPAPGEPLPSVRITLPDGTIVTSAQEHVHGLLSSILEREVILSTERPASPSVEVERLDAREPAEAMQDIGAFMTPGRFADFAAVHLIATATIDRLRALYPQGRFDARRFRPNVMVESPAGEQAFVENAWVGHTLAIGDEVRLRITDPMPRCVMTTLPQDDLPRDLGILRTVVEHNQVSIPALGGEARPSVGVGAFVLQGGTIRRGDLVRIAWADSLRSLAAAMIGRRSRTLRG
jgi:uncharacterized protein